MLGNAQKMCDNIKKRWGHLKRKLMEQDDGVTVTCLKYFTKAETTTKDGRVYTRMEMRQQQTLMKDILSFLDERIYKLIFHRYFALSFSYVFFKFSDNNYSFLFS